MNEPRVRAPQLPTDPALWLNTGGKALTLAEQRGCVVLLDFWTYGCINCLHVLPDLAYLEAKYIGRPFVVIGVHSGKFDNEKNAGNVRDAVARLGIPHAVVRDDDYKVWQAYTVHARPTFVVVDAEGYVVGSVSGEGQLDVLDALVARLLGDVEGRNAVRIRPQKPVSPSLDTDCNAMPLRFPGKVVADPLRERLYIADTGHNRLVVCDLDGRHSVVIGSGASGHADGAFDKASFAQPQGMALVGDALWVCDTGNHLLRRVDIMRQSVTTLAGTGAQAKPRSEGGTGLKTPLASPWDICYNQTEHGQLYIAMAGAHQIWRYDAQSGDIAPFAGSGREAHMDGTSDRAAFAQPTGVCTDGEHLYIADSESSSIRRADLDAKRTVTTLTGGDLFAWGDQNGQGLHARLQHPQGVCCQGHRVYIADTYNHKIKMLDTTTGEVTTLAGTGQTGLANGPREHAQLAEPGGLSVANGRCYIADTNNHSIRVLDLETGTVSTLEITGLEASSKPIL